MREIVDWLNINQGFAMISLTLVYVIATIVIVVYNRKSIKELQNTREEESRPYVFAYLHKDPRDIWFNLRIKNYGKTGAKIEIFEICPHLIFADRKSSAKLLDNVILAPNQMLYFILSERKEETVQKTYDVTIKYYPTNNYRKLYEETYSLITQYSVHMGYTENKTSSLTEEENALKNIANHLDSIRNKI